MEDNNPFKNNQIYQVLIWSDKKRSLKYFLLINLFFYFYIVRDNSFVNLLSRVTIIYVFYRAFVPAKQ